MFTANCLLCGAENSGIVCGPCAASLDTEGFDIALGAEQSSKLCSRIFWFAYLRMAYGFRL